MDLKITLSGQTIVKPTALGPVANTDTKLLIYGLFQKGRVLAQDGFTPFRSSALSTTDPGCSSALDFNLRFRRENVLRSNRLLDYGGLVLSKKSGAQQLDIRPTLHDRTY